MELIMVNVALSVGELIDKITILKLKIKFIKNKEQLKNINNELDILKPLLKENKLETDEINQLTNQLYEINLKLWKIEDDLRDKERKSEFDDEFIALARSVYFTNDNRAEIKKKINLSSGSTLLEEKSYAKY
tara:strand:- start:365 stop:760 length:396 start_codon:yes stop_codon:yes gene_type:complete